MLLVDYAQRGLISVRNQACYAVFYSIGGNCLCTEWGNGPGRLLQNSRGRVLLLLLPCIMTSGKLLFRV